MDLLRYYIKTPNNEAKLIMVTDSDVKTFMSDQTKKEAFAKFIHDRLYYRYLNPFLYSSENKIKKEAEIKEYDEYTLLFKNGFSLMANSCLLIETIEAFWRGWATTTGPNEIAFLKFFGRDKLFKEFATEDIASKFYKHVRCGILHQGETTGGWTLTRESNFLVDKGAKIINANKFIETLKLSLTTYKTELINADWNDEIWLNARKKMKAILNNLK